MSELKLYAFWSYADFPYVLGGTVAKIHDNGRVETKEYGPGYTFMPIKVLPLKRGLAIKEQLDAKREEFRQEENAFKDKWRDVGASLLQKVKAGEL